jgi:cysteine desulfurase
MHGNNEVGNLADLHAIGTLVRQHHGFFHSDTVQTVGHFPLHLQEIPVDFIAAAAHKFHGPKGNGFLYLSDRVRVEPFIYGGAQERNMRGGTENVAGIVGMAKALELACADMEAHAQHIKGLKRQMSNLLAESIDDLQYNGRSADIESSLYTVLSLSLPPNANNEMLLFRLDIAGVCASGGSACSSGAQGGSHVLNALYPASERTGVRFSFSKYNTEADIMMAAHALAEIVGHKKQSEPILA